MDFNEWKKSSNSIICLEVPNENKLISIFDKLSKITTCSIFYEPDVNQYTSICILGTTDVRKSLSNYPLIGKKEVTNV